METLIKDQTKTAKRVMTGAEAVICALLEEGVDTIFGYPGGAIMPIYDALYQYQDQVNHILVRHEQGATHAAQGYARVSNQVGVVFATSGAGKSYAVKLEILRSLMLGTDVIVIDPEDEYETLCQSVQRQG